MTISPLTQAQALYLCDHYRSLEGAAYNNDGSRIECIALAPFDDINKWIFVQFYAESRNCHKALAHYTYPSYDVILLASNPADKDKVLFEGLREYILRTTGEEPVMQTRT